MVFYKQIKPLILNLNILKKILMINMNTKLNITFKQNISVGGSIPNGEEDISPYATFHLLGMREENKGGMPNAANFQTLPSQPGMPGPQTGPNTPAHQRHTSQTMNVSFPFSFLL